MKKKALLAAVAEPCAKQQGPAAGETSTPKKASEDPTGNGKENGGVSHAAKAAKAGRRRRSRRVDD